MFSVLVVLAALLLAQSVDAQMPGLPVLQNAWATPGVMLAANAGAGRNRRVIAAAGSWSPVSRFQLSGGVGFQSGRSVASSAAFGLRAAVPLVSPSSAFGLSVFGGVGRAANATDLPFGIGLGWKHGGERGRGFSLYATPALVYFGGRPRSASLVRVALGADVGLSESWGLTGGLDFGQDRESGMGGPSGFRFGMGISRALLRRSQ